MNRTLSFSFALFLGSATLGRAAGPEPYALGQKPVLHGRHWVAITGKPLGATAGARIFERGGNAVDAACAMLGARLHDVRRRELGRRNPGAHL